MVVKEREGWLYTSSLSKKEKENIDKNKGKSKNTFCI